MACGEINRQQALRLIEVARKQTRPVSPERLGGIGRGGFSGFYAVEYGTVKLGTVKPLAGIPFVIEVWAEKTASTSNSLSAVLMINRTPAVDTVATIGPRGCKHIASNSMR
jgi:hypothetical protein